VRRHRLGLPVLMSPAEHKEYFLFWGGISVGFALYLFVLARYVRKGRK
jgi:hypothetical protein